MGEGRAGYRYLGASCFFVLPVAITTAIGYVVGRLVNYVLPNTVLGFIMGAIAWAASQGDET